MRPRVVIIEDEKDIVELVRYNFRKEGFEVESFGRGREGLDYLRRNPADVLLLDILLPDEDGFEICKRLRVDDRLKGHGEDVARLKRNRILMDGAPADNQGLLLQIFTQNAIGPIFFEIIQRKGNEGFGEGNFRALFESIEADQIKRGVLHA